MDDFDYDVSIIGAGPSGSLAATILRKKGYSVCVLEKQIFPRFSIGESLLPQCMVFMEEAGILDTVRNARFQYKDGAVFNYRGRKEEFNFSDKSTFGYSNTFQVIRSEFDKILIEESVKLGAELFYDTTVENAFFSKDGATLDVLGPDGRREIRSKFCLDASGYGRVLVKLLDLNLPSSLSKRISYFTHIKDNISDRNFNRERILITVHPEYKNIWYWLIPFSNNTASIGVIGEEEDFAKHKGNNQALLQNYIRQDNYLNQLLLNSQYDKPIQKIDGYSCGVKSLYGDSYALLGNAGEFLDPIFSSGVTIAMKSASLAANLLDKKFQGKKVSWQKDFTEPLMLGVDTFRAFVKSWYDGDLIDIFFTESKKQPSVKRYLNSILAGYAWDRTNPYVLSPTRRLKVLKDIK